MTPDAATRDTHRRLVERLLAARTPHGWWEGWLASSALSTATAVTALATSKQSSDDVELVRRGLCWLVGHQNDDGGWGDTTLSVSNTSTTALCWAALAFAPADLPDAAAAIGRVEAWLTRAAGGLEPRLLRDAIARRYGKDHTFSVPILTTLALAGRLGPDGWRLVPQLPFELAACPPRWFQWLQLPVVSYALPALIAIGQVRHAQCPSRNVPLRILRDRLRAPTGVVLRRIQPSTGGYLEATPLTSFVVMSLARMNQADGAVATDGLRFLRNSIRDDGSWPIDTHLATWVTTLAVSALAAMTDAPDVLSVQDRTAVAKWLLDQQHREIHPFTQASPGGWAWTPLPGGVPDADDTAGALLALKHLGAGDGRLPSAVADGVRWLLDLQNRDGGIPTFCRGWGALPFDRSSPDLTAHALRAWTVWLDDLPSRLRVRVTSAIPRAIAYLRSTQRDDGSWLPLWFGNQRASDDVNPTYGTAKVVLALAHMDSTRGADLLQRGTQWLCAAQNIDGGWGGDTGVVSSIEETACAVDALGTVMTSDAIGALAARPSVQRGAAWLVAATKLGEATPPSPVGFYFAKLWYYEALYPLIFATGAMGRALRAGAAPTGTSTVA